MRETGFDTKTLIASAILIFASVATIFVDGPDWLVGLLVGAAFVALIPSVYVDTKRDIQMLSVLKLQSGARMFWLTMGGTVC